MKNNLQALHRRLSIAYRLNTTDQENQIIPGIGEVVNHPQGPDWVHPSIVVRDTKMIGYGLVALDLIPKGCNVILFGGTLMSWSEVDNLPEDMKDIPFQVTDDIFYGISNRLDIGIGERINHSCNPNSGFVSEMRLVAIRDILPGEDVTMDYACCSSMENYNLICKCGEKNCRGVVKGNDWQNPDIQHRLSNYFQPYLKEKIATHKKHGLRTLLSSIFRYLANALSH